MSAMGMTLDQIKSRGYAALMKELGPVGYVRFMQQFVGFKGDYTKDRHAWIDDLKIDDIKNGIDRLQRQHQVKPRGDEKPDPAMKR